MSTPDPRSTTKTALVVRGGCDGHQPVEATNLFIPFLEARRYTVRVQESPAVYADSSYMPSVDLIVQSNTMTSIEKESSPASRLTTIALTPST